MAGSCKSIFVCSRISVSVLLNGFLPGWERTLLGGVFPEFSGNDPIFFRNSQQLSQSFSGILRNCSALFLKFSAAELDFFRNSQKSIRSFFKILSS
jgi:hypothetical protein